MAADLAGYLARRMMAPDGGFYTAEDADMEGKEGASYLWTRAEITDVLGSANADRFFGLYELTPMPSEPNGPGVLRIRRDQIVSAESRANFQGRVAELVPLRAKLLEVRDRRPQPTRDDKIVVALNGLAIAGLARAGKILGEPQWIASASRAGEFLWQNAFDEKSGRLRHHLFQGDASGEGFLDDYAMLGLAYLALGEATGEPIWASRAQANANPASIDYLIPTMVTVPIAHDAKITYPAGQVFKWRRPTIFFSRIVKRRLHRLPTGRGGNESKHCVCGFRHALSFRSLLLIERTLFYATPLEQ